MDSIDSVALLILSVSLLPALVVLFFRSPVPDLSQSQSLYQAEIDESPEVRAMCRLSLAFTTLKLSVDSLKGERDKLAAGLRTELTQIFLSSKDFQADAIKDLREEFLNDTKAYIQSLESEGARLCLAVEELKDGQAIDQLKSENLALMSQIQILRKENSALKNELNALTLESDSIRFELSDLCNKLQNSELESSQTRFQTQEMKFALDDKTGRVLELEGLVIILNQERDSAKHELKQINAKANIISVEKEVADRRCNELESIRSTLARELETIRDNVNKLTSQVKFLGSEKKNLWAQIGDMQKERRNLESSFSLPHPSANTTATPEVSRYAPMVGIENAPCKLKNFKNFVPSTPPSTPEAGPLTVEAERIDDSLEYASIESVPSTSFDSEKFERLEEMGDLEDSGGTVADDQGEGTQASENQEGNFRGSEGKVEDFSTADSVGTGRGQEDGEAEKEPVIFNQGRPAPHPQKNLPQTQIHESEKISDDGGEGAEIWGDEVY